MILWVRIPPVSPLSLEVRMHLLRIEERNPLQDSPDEWGRKVRYLQRESANYIITLIGGDIKIDPNLSHFGAVEQKRHIRIFVSFSYGCYIYY